MKAFKVLCIFGLILASACIVQTKADPAPKPEPAKAHRSAYFNEPANPRFRSVALPVDIDDEAIAELRQADDNAANVNANANEDDGTANVPVKGDASSGRLFMKKFLLFKNIFGANTQQPVIPIIITGAGTGTATANPTTTVTSTGTVPTATGTITTSPATREGPRESVDEEGNEEGEEPQAVDVQALQAALAANAAEYVVTDQEIKGTSDSKATKQPQSINLRPKGGKKGQYITVRIPPKYRRYFKSGQKVMLNTNNRVGGGNRRVIRKRNNKNRRRVNNNNNNNNRNKNNRFVPFA